MFDSPRSGCEATPAESLERTASLAGRLERATVELVCTLAVVVARGDYEIEGALSPVAWLAHRSPLGAGESKALVKLARVVASCDLLRELLAGGALSMEKVRILAAVAIPARRKIWERDAELLVDLAMMLDPDDLRRAAAHWADLADDELNRGEPKDLHDNRRLTTAFSGNRGELHAYGPASDIAAIEQALDRNQPPDPTGGAEPPRSLVQRRYDALIELTRRGAARPDGRLDPEHTVDVLIDYETFCRALGLPTTTDPIDALDTMRAEILDGPVLPGSTLERISCDSWVRRLIFGPDGEVLDLGRSQRLFSTAQRRAIRIRDGGCVFPGCDRPPQWCDIHHVIEWDDGGNTIVHNGACMCRGHHTLVHEGGWTLWRDADGTWHADPP